MGVHLLKICHTDISTSCEQSQSKAILFISIMSIGTIARVRPYALCLVIDASDLELGQTELNKAQ